MGLGGPSRAGRGDPREHRGDPPRRGRSESLRRAAPRGLSTLDSTNQPAQQIFCRGGAEPAGRRPLYLGPPAARGPALQAAQAHHGAALGEGECPRQGPETPPVSLCARAGGWGRRVANCCLVAFASDNPGVAWPWLITSVMWGLGSTPNTPSSPSSKHWLWGSNPHPQAGAGRVVSCEGVPGLRWGTPALPCRPWALLLSLRLF